jgi:hypothetical protein
VLVSSGRPAIRRSPSAPLNIETLNALNLRLREHAEDISVEISFEPIVRDIRLAARVCTKLATLRCASRR